MRSDKQLRRDGSLRNLSANLTLIRPYISRQPESLSYELLGRLVKYINQVTLYCAQMLASNWGLRYGSHHHHLAPSEELHHLLQSRASLTPPCATI